MSIYVVIIIMIAAGLLGGCVNYLLPSNEKDGIKIRQLINCIILGTGATLLVPLFLEIAQSKLLDNMYFGWKKADIISSAVGNTLKNYLLFTAYCLVAAAAGFRFIDSVINSVVKEKEAFQLMYDGQTDHSRNKKVQQEWLDKIQQLLTETEPYSDYP